MELTKEYEPPTVANGSSASFEHPVLAPGVTGYAIESDDKSRIYIPLVTAEHEGNGDVGRFIDSLSSRCVFANVCSPRLQGMLERRGYTKTFEFDPMEGEDCDVWVKP